MSNPSKMDSSIDDLSKLITKLLQRTAQINMLPPDSRKIRDIIAFEDKKGRHVYYQIVRELTGDDGSWVLVSRDQPLWHEVVAKLYDLNPKVCSTRQVDKMLEDLADRFKSKGWRLSGILQDTRALIRDIRAAKGVTRRVFLPIWGLVIKVSSFVVGDVEFISRTKDTEIDEELKKHESASNESEMSKVNTVAVTETTGGDSDMILQNAETKVNQALSILRAFVYPTVPDTGQKQIGIMGSFYTLPKFYFVEFGDVGTEKSPKRSRGYELFGIMDVTISEYVTKELLDKGGFSKLNTFLTSSKTSKFQESLLRGAQWLGEATKPDTLESKFIKVAFAVDAMVGDEASDKIPDKGIKARIAERSAFLLASKRKHREQICEEMSRFIAKRNNLAHGSKQVVSQWETERFGAYGRTVLERLLLSDPEFKSTEQLATWVLHNAFRG